MSQLYKRLVGTHKRQADAILKVRGKILGGTMVSLDPGSNSLGFCFFVCGELVHSGSIQAKGSIGKRLRKLTKALEDERCRFALPEVDVVVTEFLRSNTGHIYLTWAAGAAVGAMAAEHTLEVTTGAWRKNVGSDYVKGDEQDAIEIGKFAVTLCKEAVKPRKGRRGNTKLRRPRNRAA